MSSETPVIRVEGVSKYFAVYGRPEDRLKEFLMPRLRAGLGLEVPRYHREFWALRNVSFEVGKGQTVGIIGQNGSGKSTLLQIITGTMTPTSGTVSTHGRIAALLELGSGFNPEFTGRENVYLNASLLGFDKAQTDERFDYIAGFADIGEHLDQPVKTYSSGMMLRLAFAVQIAVETEILIIDEALAVGDARFQLKCFRRLEELKTQGTTILFVSHATELVRSFCDFGLVLDKGNPIFWGGAKEATIRYFTILFPEEVASPVALDVSAGVEVVKSGMGSGAEPLSFTHSVQPPYQGDSFGSGGAQLDRLRISGMARPNIVIPGTRLRIACDFSWSTDVVRDHIAKDKYDANIGISIAIADKKGNYIFGCNGFDNGFVVDALECGSDSVEFELEWPCLMEGSYFMTVAIPLGSLKHHVQLKWYDYLFEISSMKGEKNAFGIVGIDYRMKRVPNVALKEM